MEGADSCSRSEIMKLPQKGYAKLSQFCGPNQEYAIFRKFSELNMLNLFYMQAELSHLEQELNDLTFRDETSTDTNQNGLWKSWYDLKMSNGKQLEKVLELREKLEKYNDAVLKVAQLDTLQGPDASNLKDLKAWMRRSCAGFGNNQIVAPGIEAFTWSKMHERDLVCLSPKHIDLFTRKIIYEFLVAYSRFQDFFKKFNKSKHALVDAEGRIHDFSDDRIEAVGNILAGLFAATIPVAAIVSLFFTPSLPGRMAVSFGYTLLLTSVLAALSSAKRSEIFAAALAFLAIEVVFIGSASLATR